MERGVRARTLRERSPFEQQQHTILASVSRFCYEKLTEASESYINDAGQPVSFRIQDVAQQANRFVQKAYATELPSWAFADSFLKAITLFISSPTTSLSREATTEFLRELTETTLQNQPELFKNVHRPSLGKRLGELVVHDTVPEKLVLELCQQFAHKDSFYNGILLKVLSKTPATNSEKLQQLLVLPRVLLDASRDTPVQHHQAIFNYALKVWAHKPERSVLQKLVADSGRNSLNGSFEVAEPMPETFASPFIYANAADEQPSLQWIARDAYGRIDEFGFLQELGTDPKVQRQNLDEYLALMATELPELLVAANRLLWFCTVAEPRFQTLTHLEQAFRDSAALAQSLQILAPKDPSQFLGLLTTWSERNHLLITRPLRQVDQHLGSIEQGNILRALHAPPIKEVIESCLQIPLQALSLREQLRFGEWILNANEARGGKTLELVRRFGSNAARTFLALEANAAHGERILAFAEKATPEVAACVFETFARIADKIDLSAQDLAQELYQEGKVQPVDAERVRSELVKRGSTILLEAEASLKRDSSGADLLRALEKYEADTVLFVSLCKGALKGRETDFTEFRQLQTELVPQESLSAADREQMQHLLNQEWSKKPLEYLFPPVGSFNFFLLRRQGRVIGFMRFEDIAQGERHANFLCVDHSMRGSGLGENLFREAIDRGARSATLKAEFDAAIPAGSMYIERFGFVATGVTGEDRPEGYTEWITIERDNALLARLPSRQATVERVRSWKTQGAPEPLHLVTFSGAPTTMELGMIAAMKKAQRKDPRYVLSRYLLTSLPDGQEERTLVFDLPIPAASPSATKTQTSDGAMKRSRRPGSPTPHRDRYAE